MNGCLFLCILKFWCVIYFSHLSSKSICISPIHDYSIWNLSFLGERRRMIGKKRHCYSWTFLVPIIKICCVAKEDALFEIFLKKPTVFFGWDFLNSMAMVGTWDPLESVLSRLLLSYEAISKRKHRDVVTWYFCNTYT